MHPLQNRNRWVCCNEGSKSTDSESSTEGARVIGTQVFGRWKPYWKGSKGAKIDPHFGFWRAIFKSCGLFRRCQKITTKSDTDRRWKHEIWGSEKFVKNRWMLGILGEMVTFGIDGGLLGEFRSNRILVVLSSLHCMHVVTFWWGTGWQIENCGCDSKEQWVCWDDIGKAAERQDHDCKSCTKALWVRIPPFSMTIVVWMLLEFQQLDAKVDKGQIDDKTGTGSHVIRNGQIHVLLNYVSFLTALYSVEKKKN